MPSPFATLRSLQELRHVRREVLAASAQPPKPSGQQPGPQQAAAPEVVFAQAVGAVRPLDARHRGRAVLRAAPAALLPAQRLREQQAVMQEALSDAIDTSALLHTDEALSWQRAGVGPDVVRRLRQGRWSIQCSLDLHGLRRDAARDAVGAFVADCRRRGLRCVRIVTGKGLGSAGGQPVLKQRVHGWLMQKREVLAFVQARAMDGGAGALVVLLDKA